MKKSRRPKCSDELMDEAALIEGKRLLEEFTQAKARGELPPFSEELDEKCRSLIHSTFAAQGRKKTPQAVYKVIGRAAAVVLVLFCAGSILIASVEAIRTPAFRFLFGESERYSTIIMDDTPPSSFPTAPLQSEERKKSPLIGFLPEGYELIRFSFLETGGFFSHYENDENHSITFHALSLVENYSYDTENAEVSQIKVLEYDGVLVKKDAYRFIWIDDATKIIYSLRVSNMDYEEAWDLVEAIAQCPDWSNMIYGG